MYDMFFVFRLANAYCIQQYAKAKRDGDLHLAEYWKTANNSVNETIEEYKRRFEQCLNPDIIR